MTSTDSTASSRELGDELRRLRDMTGLDSALMADRLGWHSTTLTQWELGRARITELDLLRFLVHCGLEPHAIDGFVVRHRLAVEPYLSRPGCDRLPENLRTLTLAEAAAESITSFDLATIPGLLQTEDYARALLDQLGLTPPDEVGPAVRARVARQAMLRPYSGPFCTFFIHENALRMKIGGDRVMEDQLLRLIFQATSPRCVIRIVPASVGGAGALSAGCKLIEYPDSVPLVYTETEMTRSFSTEPQAIARSQLIFERLDQLAIMRQPSRTLMMEYMAEYDRPREGEDAEEMA
ncbi:helix-turn-helix domain-containing protein [Umezawaea tangerina]|uniref:Helix-turn-helix protein n=1 Tax=Umezawaea tangerina TaxID=84725 RepID=A0A2T0SRS8_9PSEU|nr:helix-turn-helix transcriptional regulator [Umezawaea tangerina]PRY36110.1 helix-turn-helix protein [Umezawaea tangerina]